MQPFSGPHCLLPATQWRGGYESPHILTRAHRIIHVLIILVLHDNFHVKSS